ncbi:MAG: formylglycine-generating enzyme family protein, partial [Candidatus Sumerlaeia bacterium]|nr:formylglycine-generating enzyme family protein [Candidatus Sumerlaeia bacterium]
MPLFRIYTTLWTVCLLALTVGVAGAGGTGDDPGRSVTIMLPGDVPLAMKQIPAGTFVMGSPPDERGRRDDEPPAVTVHITRDYLIGIHPVTQKQWVAVMGRNPSHFSGDRHPVERVSWDETQKFIKTLNGHLRKSGQTGLTLRLPTEAEWEYACRAGTTTRFFFGDSLDCADDDSDCAAGKMEGNRSDYMWWRGNSGGSTQPVGKLNPNPWGLYDMHGNVWE